MTETAADPASHFLVRVRLEGDEWDLRILEAEFASPDPVIVKEEGWWLSSAAIDRAKRDGRSALHEAGKILILMNGALKLRHSDYRSVSISSRYDVLALDGTRHIHFEITDEVTVRSQITATLDPDEPAAGRPSTGSSNCLAVLQLAGGNADVAEALELLAGPATWSDLWKVYEIVRSAEGGEKGLKIRGYGTDPQRSAFRVSANSPAVSGRNARHARFSEASKRTMTLAEGSEFIRWMAHRWMGRLLAGIG